MDVFGENVIVVWEFGRVGIFEVGRGRVTEVCELKTGIGSLKSAWGIRRVKDKAEGVFVSIFSYFLSTRLTKDSMRHVVSYFRNGHIIHDPGFVDYTFHDTKPSNY